MLKKIAAFLSALLLTVSGIPISAGAALTKDTPNYKVAFYAFDCYHMQDANGKRTGYGYEMMQGLSAYLQCTFSYVGYDKSAVECEQMLRDGELDIYTAAKKTPEREQEFAFTTHPAITSSTCMNIKIGNNTIKAGDYSTYNGIRVGLLRRHTYNHIFLDFVKQKGFDCDIVYYETPTDLTNALINDEVDALVNSYIRIPEDEKTIENFGETPYYIMARKEDQALMEQLDQAFDRMNEEIPNWRTDLYNKYYGSEAKDLDLTEGEQKLLQELKDSGTVLRAVVDPDAAPYSWYENGQAHGITADLFRATAEKLGLPYEFLPVVTHEEYNKAITSGSADIWADMDSCYEDEDKDGEARYKLTDPYLYTTLSVLRQRGASDRIRNLITNADHITLREIIAKTWPSAELTVDVSPEACAKQVASGKADGALLLSYTAQKLARDDVQNRLRVDIVPGATMELRMGVNANDDYRLFGLWEKTLAGVAAQRSAEIVQNYAEQTETPSLPQYLFDHPTYLIGALAGAFLLLLFVLLYVQSVRRRQEQERISLVLSDALERAEEATKAKQEFFSKMSHDIRTPLNVVLGMTQIAKKYQNNAPKLDKALDNISTEGNYLLVLINSILDVNQLEHGTIELLREPFNPASCLQESADILRPLFGKKEQSVSVDCQCTDHVVLGDANRLRQILINIVSNAIKYTNTGGHIALSLTYAEPDRYRFTCTDNGIGMSEEFVKHICEDYARAEDSRVSKTQGTGLGMSVVKGFTELMGGTLTIRSELGKGSTFQVELPFPAASAEQRESVLHPPVQTEEDKPAYTGKKVLLVEDNALNAEIAMELLETIGLRVDWAENGKAGIEHFEASAEGEYYAVFMDMQMPVMDGVTATKLIRQSKRPDSTIPVFAMTANTFVSDRQSCQDAGMNGFIPKPVSVKNIATALTEIKP